jgi:hypothetical protein
MGGAGASSAERCAKAFELKKTTSRAIDKLRGRISNKILHTCKKRLPFDSLF